MPIAGRSSLSRLLEQQFYADRGFSEPRRCSSCRAIRKAQRDSGGNRSYSSGGSSFGNSGGYSSGGGGSGGYDRAPREMFTATCSNCGKDAQVPFRPTSGKPILLGLLPHHAAAALLVKPRPYERARHWPGLFSLRVSWHDR